MVIGARSQRISNYASALLLGGRFDFFFCSGRGNGEAEASGGGGGMGLFIENPRRGGGVPGGGGAEGPGGCLSAANWGIWEFGGGGLNIFLWG